MKLRLTLALFAVLASSCPGWAHSPSSLIALAAALDAAPVVDGRCDATNGPVIGNLLYADPELRDATVQVKYTQDDLFVCIRFLPQNPVVPSETQHVGVFIDPDHDGGRFADENDLAFIVPLEFLAAPYAAYGDGAGGYIRALQPLDWQASRYFDDLLTHTWSAEVRISVTAIPFGASRTIGFQVTHRSVYRFGDEFSLERTASFANPGRWADLVGGFPASALAPIELGDVLITQGLTVDADNSHTAPIPFVRIAGKETLVRAQFYSTGRPAPILSAELEIHAPSGALSRFPISPAPAPLAATPMDFDVFVPGSLLADEGLYSFVLLIRREGDDVPGSRLWLNTVRFVRTGPFRVLLFQAEWILAEDQCTNAPSVPCRQDSDCPAAIPPAPAGRCTGEQLQCTAGGNCGQPLSDACCPAPYSARWSDGQHEAAFFDMVSEVGRMFPVPDRAANPPLFGLADEGEGGLRVALWPGILDCSNLLFNPIGSQLGGKVCNNRLYATFRLLFDWINAQRTTPLDSLCGIFPTRASRGGQVRPTPSGPSCSFAMSSQYPQDRSASVAVQELGHMMGQVKTPSPNQAGSPHLAGKCRLPGCTQLGTICTLTQCPGPNCECPAGTGCTNPFTPRSGNDPCTVPDTHTHNGNSSRGPLINMATREDIAASQLGSVMDPSVSGPSSKRFFEGFEWNDLAAQLRARSSAVRARSRASVSDVPRFILTGSIDRNDKLIVFFSQRVDLPLETTPEDPTGRYRLSLLDEFGEQLADVAFEPDFSKTHPEEPGSSVEDRAALLLTVPLPTGSRAVEITKDGAPLYVREFPQSPPNVTTIVASPISDDVVDLQWSADHPEGMPLLFNVYWDAGTAMPPIPIAFGLTDNSHQLRTDLVPANAEARVIVEATDGLNTDSAISNSFVVPERAPFVGIAFPRAGDRLVGGKTTTLSGLGWNPTSGALVGEGLVWRSNRDGELGTGANLQVSLSPGLHELELIGRTPFGATASERIEVSVEEDADGDGVSDLVEAAHPCLDGTTVDSFDDPDGDRIATLREIAWGTDPCRADSDADGFDDSEETRFGGDPLVRSVRPSEGQLYVPADEIDLGACPTPASVDLAVDTSLPDLAWAASPAADWLLVTGASTGPGVVEVTADCARLPPGVHRGEVLLGAAGKVRSVSAAVTSGSSSTTTTTIPIGCGAPDGPSFASLNCQLDALIAAVEAEPLLGKLQLKVLKTARKAKKRKDMAESLCARGKTRRSGRQLKRVVRKLIQFSRRLRSKNARTSIDESVRDPLAQDADALQEDTRLLRSRLDCGT